MISIDTAYWYQRIFQYSIRDRVDCSTLSILTNWASTMTELDGKLFIVLAMEGRNEMRGDDGNLNCESW